MRDEDPVSVIGSLAEPTRREVYDFVVAAGDWVSRDKAAAGVGLGRGTAAHHLDRLVADGLLEVDYQRLSGRAGPGAGRPAKLYRRAPREFGVSLPPRAYELAGRMLAQAADATLTGARDLTGALRDAAAAEGHRMADRIRDQLRGTRTRTAGGRRRVALDVLSSYGFEPATRPDGTVVLRNCPFHDLAQEHTELICGMNHDLMRAALVELAGLELDARLEPEDGYCCVKLHPQ